MAQPRYETVAIYNDANYRPSEPVHRSGINRLLLRSTDCSIRELYCVLKRVSKQYKGANRTAAGYGRVGWRARIGVV